MCDPRETRTILTDFTNLTAPLSAAHSALLRQRAVAARVQAAPALPAGRTGFLDEFESLALRGQPRLDVGAYADMAVRLGEAMLGWGGNKSPRSTLTR